MSSLKFLLAFLFILYEISLNGGFCFNSQSLGFKTDSSGCPLSIDQINRLENKTNRGLLEKIVGGTNAALCQYPWQVIISNKIGICGASLINNQLLVTAAH